MKYIRKYYKHYLFLVPFFIVFCIFFLWPILYGIGMSFTNWQARQAPVFIGIDNYSHLFKSTNFTAGMRNLFLYIIIALPINMIVALFLALLVDQFKGIWHQFFRAVYFLPFVIPLFLAAGIWRWMFTPEYGLINVVIKMFGGPDVQWLNEPSAMIFAILIVDMWRAAGFNMVILLAGIKAIPSDYYEAAKIDGASTIQQMVYITIPLLEPVLFLVVVNAFISIIQLFDVPWLLSRSDYNTQGGPQNGMLFPVMDMLGLAFGKQRFGEASTYAVVFLALALLITIVQFVFRRWYAKR